MGTKVAFGKTIVGSKRLLELGALEKREEPDLQYRWCSAYRVVIE